VIRDPKKIHPNTGGSLLSPVTSGGAAMITCKRVLFLLPLFLLVSACNAQHPPVDRQPAVAGQFYPGRAEDLKRTLHELFSQAVPRRDPAHVLALIVPHAGYVYSGGVAASGFNQIDADTPYENVFVIGPSHHRGFEGASVYCAGDFVTPLGTVKVNRDVGEELAKNHHVFTTRPEAHTSEHSVEVELPFLQTRLRRAFQIVPIVVGAQTPETCRKIAAALRPFFNDNNLFVVSSDFSHYPAYDAAVRVDSATAGAIVSNSPDILIQTLQLNEQSGIPELATSLCGWAAVLTLLYMTSPDNDIAYHIIQYKNSGDVQAGDKSRVVGYSAISVTRQAANPTTSFELNREDRAALLAIARRTVEEYVTTESIPPVDSGRLSGNVKTPCGAFVTLNKHGTLRGCIGRFDASDPLYQVVQQMTIASATQDQRFNPVTPGELGDIEIEISVLTPMKKITSIDEFHLGKHGIYMRKGMRSGTFLPQVAAETGWTREEFLGHCAQDKAGIGWEGWKDADLYVYEALVFSEKEPAISR
jgi:MEMO1 family protein